MRQHITLFFVLLTPFLAFSSEVFESNLLTAKRKAATQGKLLMLDFTAKWCAPCKFMDQHTFSDGRVNNYFAASFVPVKIDIDDFDGYALKQRYEVNILPTIVILDSRGNLLAKYEESMAPSRLLQIMESHDLPANKVITMVEPEPEPLEDDGILSGPESDTGADTSAENAPTYYPPFEETETSINVPPSEPNPNPIPNPVPEQPTYEPTPAAPNTPENNGDAPLESGTGLFRFSVESQASTGFSVQIGAFYQYENVLVQVSQLQQIFDHIIVNANRLNGEPVYKILLGHFDTADDARLFARKLDDMGMTGSFTVALENLL